MSGASTVTERTRRSDTIGAVLVRNLVLGDYAGRVYVVNPAADAVAGMPAYATVGDIPGDVDVAIVAVPAEAVQDVVLDCAAKGVHGLIVISAASQRPARRAASASASWSAWPVPTACA